MSLQPIRQQPFRQPKEAIADWNTFRKGLNLFSRQNEIAKDEMVQTDNLLLTGSGVPSKRWGSQTYYTAGATGYGRFVLPIKQDSSGSIDVLSLTDWGILTKKNGNSYTALTGASWPSGYPLDGVQLGGKVYFVSQQRELVKYDFTSLIGFPTLSSPAGLVATNISAATGLTQWSWSITATSRSGGETIGSTRYSLVSLPQTLSNTMVRLTWTPVSAASGDLVGYNIYRGAPGDEQWIGGVDDTTTRFDDFGQGSGDVFRTVPTANTTGGPKAAYIIRYQDRLVMAGIPGDVTKVLISGRYPQQERFDWYAGGGFIQIEPDSGESITGLATYYQASSQTQTIIVFKEKSVWELRLGFVTVGNYTILDPQYRLLTNSQGCSSHWSIQSVENDIMFANTKGIYILRYEPQLIGVINANELSAKIRPFFEGLTNTDKTTCCSAYVDKKYLLSFPVSKKTITYDRERTAFMGPWTTPFGINRWASYIDSTGVERWICADADDNLISEFSEGYGDDKSTAISTIFKSRKEDFGDWTLYKTINEIYFNFRQLVGSLSVNIYIEDRSGSTVTAKAFTITAPSALGTSGFGIDLFGLPEFGTTMGTPSISNDEVPKKAFLYKSSRYFQVEIRTTGRQDDYELLGVKTVANPQARGNSPSSWNVSS